MLASYQERICTVVSDWMDHYREHIGIRPRSQIGSNITSRSPTRATSSQGRRAKSSMSVGYGQSTCTCSVHNSEEATVVLEFMVVGGVWLVDIGQLF